jgi:hypothetical protein
LNSKINQIIGESLENTSAVEIFKKLYFDFQIRSDEEIYIWGTGEFAKQLMSNRSDLNVICFVDSNENIHDSEFMGRKIKSPKILLDSDRKIVIASVNNYGEIIKLLMDMGVSKNRIVPNFII